MFFRSFTSIVICSFRIEYFAVDFALELFYHITDQTKQWEYFHLHVSCKPCSDLCQGKLFSAAEPSIFPSGNGFSMQRMLCSSSSPYLHGQVRGQRPHFCTPCYSALLWLLFHTQRHRGGQRRTFHNSKGRGGLNILRKQHSLPVKLSQADDCLV